MLKSVLRPNMKSLISFTLLAGLLICVSIDDAADNMTSAMPSNAGPRKPAAVTLGNPRSVAVDRAGNLYVADIEAQKVFKITPEGRVTTMGGGGGVAIAAPMGISVGADDSVYVADLDNGGVYRISPQGVATSLVQQADASKLAGPAGAVADSAGNVFVANNGNNTIVKITPAGAVSVFAGKTGEIGSTDGAGNDARFATPRGIAIDGKDNLYVADEGNSNVRKITPAGVVTTLAGMAGEAGTADGNGAAARFGAPRGLAADAGGNVYVADTDNHCIRKITALGAVTTMAGKAGESGKVDGAGSAARFNNPRGIAVDAAGNVYVADSDNAAIREITPDGIVTTIVQAKP